MNNPSENRDVRPIGEAERKNTEDQAARPQKGEKRMEYPGFYMIDG